jgi:integrase
MRVRGREAPQVVAAFRLLILTGCRLGEIQTLKWSHVNGDRLMLPDSKTGAKTVYLGAAAVAVLGALSRDQENEYVIAGEIPKRYWTDLQRPWRRLRSRAGLDGLRIHDLRHSFASSAVGGGESLPMIGKLLGHKQVQTTALCAPRRRSGEACGGEYLFGHRPPVGADAGAFNNLIACNRESPHECR